MKKKLIEREENFFRFRNKKDNKVYYDSIPVELINKASFLKDKKRICAYAYNWHFEVIEGVKRVVYSFNACEQFVFERVYTLDGTVNDELLRLLEKTESIRLCDGEIDFDRVLMRNFNFAIEKNRKGNLYKMKRFCLVPDSYRENLGAFYDIDEIFWKLAQKHEKPEPLPEDVQSSPIASETPSTSRRHGDTSYDEENIIIKAFENPEMMRDSPMLDYILAERLLCENVRYIPSEDIYLLSVKMDLILGDCYHDDIMMGIEPSVPIVWVGNKHYYHTEVEVNTDFYNMLQRLGAIDEYECPDFDSEVLYTKEFELILIKEGKRYFFNGLHIVDKNNKNCLY